MRKKFLLAGILLLVGGGSSVYGAYFMFNYYSMRDAHHFDALAQTWRFPDTPIQLSEGDVLRIGAVLWGNGTVRICVVNAAGTQVQLQPSGGVYSVETSDLYHINVTAERLRMPYGLDIGLSVGVTQKAPDPFSLVVGTLGMFMGAVLVSAAFLYKRKPVKET